MIEVFDREIPEMEGADTLATRVVGIERHADVRWKTIRSRVRPEVVIECMVLLHEHDEMTDRRVRLAPRCADRCWQENEEERSDDEKGTRKLHGRTS
jgi:hypothetical protein